MSAPAADLRAGPGILSRHGCLAAGHADLRQGRERVRRQPEARTAQSPGAHQPVRPGHRRGDVRDGWHLCHRHSHRRRCGSLPQAALAPRQPRGDHRRRRCAGTRAPAAAAARSRSRRDSDCVARIRARRTPGAARTEGARRPRPRTRGPPIRHRLPHDTFSHARHRSGVGQAGNAHLVGRLSSADRRAAASAGARESGVRGDDGCVCRAAGRMRGAQGRRPVERRDARRRGA